jgi:hypothetical protein
MQFEPVNPAVIESTEARLAGITTALASLATVVELVADSPSSWYRVALTGLVEVRDDLAGLSKALALDGVRSKALTQVEAGRLLGVGSRTIGRWLVAQAAEAPGTATPTPDQGHHPAT